MRSAVLVLAFVATLHAETAPVDASTPEEAILSRVAALRRNDLAAWFHSMPETKQAQVREAWNSAATANASKDEKLTQQLALVWSPDAVDLIMAGLEPKLAQVDPQKVSMGAMMVGGMIAMSLSKDDSNKDLAQTVQKLVTDICAWLPTAGLDDATKAREAVTHLIAAAKVLQVHDASELRALSVDALFDRAGASLVEIKAGLRVYGLDFDGLLDSVAVSQIEGDGDHRTATVRFTAFGHQHSLPMRLVQQDGNWVADTAGLGEGLDGMGLPGVQP
jgi:hypothetical protein